MHDGGDGEVTALFEIEWFEFLFCGKTELISILEKRRRARKRLGART
jgi:hypothetical protein